MVRTRKRTAEDQSIRDLRQRVARIIRRVRFRLGQTQSEFAKQYLVGQSVISEWETGTRNPGREALLLMAEIALPVEAESLRRLADEARPRYRSVSRSDLTSFQIAHDISVMRPEANCNF